MNASTDSNLSAPLSGITVLDLSRVLAGPWCTQLLADLGAEVIKIERPGSGDDTRSWGPPYLLDREGKETEESAYYLCCNRGKKSVAIDIAQVEGQRLIQELAKQADVLVENFKVGGLKKYGLDYDHLKAMNPRLIYCSITGFGQNGPYAERPGYDLIIQGMGGLMSITGEPDDKPGGGPQRAGVAVVDLFTGLYAANAIQAALFHQLKTGEGQYIDMALLDCQVAMLANQGLNYLTSGVAPHRIGNSHPSIVPYQVFACKDGHFILAVGNDHQFQLFCQIIQQPELAQDLRFITNEQRVAHRQELVNILQTVLLTGSQMDWLRRCEEAGVPCGPINLLDQVFQDPQVQHRHLAMTMPHLLAGRVRLTANPIQFSRTPIQYIAPPPLLGEHTYPILQERLKVSLETMQNLMKAKTIQGYGSPI